MLVFRRVWHPCHTHAALLLILPQKPQNAQKFLAEKSLPQMHTDEHRLGVPAGGVGMAGCHTLLQKLPQIALPRYNNKIATLQQQDCHATIKHRKRTSNQETNKQSRNEQTIKKRTNNQETNEPLPYILAERRMENELEDALGDRLEDNPYWSGIFQPLLH